MDSLPRLDALLQASVGRTNTFFAGSDPLGYGLDSSLSSNARITAKMNGEYKDSQVLPSALATQQSSTGPAKPAMPLNRKLITAANGTTNGGTNGALTKLHAAQQQPSLLSSSLIRRKEANAVKPDYHPKWKLMRVISGHLGWVRAVAVEPGNQWFATGAGDRVIKIWDLASGELKLSLTGHISTVRGLAVSDRHPYLFSCGEDKMVKCWDLETNKVIRHYHGHLSGVYSLALHPTLDVLVSGGRDAAVRVWDMRTKAQIHVMTGHTSTICALGAQGSDPQVISGSMDSTIRLWDLAAGKTSAVLTHHHKSVRSLAIHPTEFSFASGSAGGHNIKKWAFPEGHFVHNFEGHNAIINTVSVNEDGVFISGGDNGTLAFWDYKTGLMFDSMDDKPQPGSLDAEAGIFCSTFDKTGSRLITGCADKTIKIYGETS